MPPKKAAGGNVKAAEAKRAKVAADKTFGLKNKNKSKKVQQYVSQVSQAAMRAGKTPQMLKEESLKKKEREEAKLAKKNGVVDQLFTKVVKKTVVGVGVDPKSVVCEFYKAGNCIRGNKCKYSHDINVERKKEKINLYVDQRELAPEDDMANWDQEKLEKVVNQKYVNRPNATKIVCKYFIEAVETKKYGWFWKCPSGAECMYQHKLPPGFVLKSDQPKEEEKEDGPSLEEQIEIERKQLNRATCTMVTPETFAKWKEEQKLKKREKVEEERKLAAKKSGGRGLHALSGRALFEFDPSLFVDDDDAANDDAYVLEDEDEDAEPTKEHEAAASLATAIDESLFLDDLDDDDLPSDEE